MRALVKQCCKDDKFVDALHEGMQNVCIGTVPLHPDDHEYVRKHHARLAEALGDRYASRRKIRALTQQGGFPPLLAAILPAVVSTVGSLVGGIVKKKLAR